MSDNMTDQPIVLRAPLPFSQELLTLPHEFPVAMLAELLRRGYERIDGDQTKRRNKSKGELNYGTSEADGRG